MMFDLTGQLSAFDGGELAHFTSYKTYLDNRNLGGVNLYLSFSPLGFCINSFQSIELIQHYLLEYNRVHIKTKEGLYLIFDNEDIINDRGDLISKDSMILLFSLLEDSDMFDLANRDAEWCHKILEEYSNIKSYVNGSSLIIENSENLKLKRHLKEEYNILVLSENENKVEMNFIYNRLFSIPVDSSKLGFIINNFFNENKHKIFLF